MKRSHFYLLILAFALVPAALFVTSMVTSSQHPAATESYQDERPTSFSLHGARRSSTSSIFLRSMKAGLSFFGLVPRDQAEEVLKSFLAETAEEKTEQEDSEEDDSEQMEAENSDEEKEALQRAQLPEGFSPWGEDSYEKGPHSKEPDSTFGGGTFQDVGPWEASPSPLPAGQAFMDQELPEDAESWLQKIKSHRSFKVFSQFVAFYQVGNIPPEIFYTVARALMEESDPLLAKYGVLALTGTPDTESFVTLLEGRAIVLPETEILQLLSQGVRAYSEPTHLHHLFAILRFPDRTEEFARAVELTEISIQDWYVRAEAAEEGAFASAGVYVHLRAALYEGLRRSSAVDLSQDIERLLDLLGGGEELLIGGTVPN